MATIAHEDQFRISQMEHLDDQAKTEPTSFLLSFFSKEKTFDTKFVEIDIQRYGRAVAVSVPLGTSGNLNESGQFQPPMYDEYRACDAFVLGYSASTAVMDRVRARIVKQQLECRRVIIQAMEVQARQALFGAKLHTREGVVNFNTKSEDTGLIDAVPAKPWTDPNGDKIQDLAEICNRIRIHGKTTPTMAVFGSDSFIEFAADEKVNKRLDQRYRDPRSLVLPQLNNSAAVYHGTLSILDYTLEIWTYPQFFDGPVTSDPLIEPNAMNPYIPKNQVLVLDPKARRTQAYGGVPTLKPLSPDIAQMMGVSHIPLVTNGKMFPYHWVDKSCFSMIAGVRSRPLLIPTAIDTHANLVTH